MITQSQKCLKMYTSGCRVTQAHDEGSTAISCKALKSDVHAQGECSHA